MISGVYPQLDTMSKFLVSVLGSQRDFCNTEEFGRRRPPKSMGWNVSTHYTSCSDHRSFTNPHIRQDDAVRTDKDVLFDDNSSVAFWPSGPPVEVSEDGGSKADGAIVADRDVSGMQFVYVYKLADPDVLANPNSTQPI